MLKGYSSDITVNVIASIIASLVLLAAGFLWGKYKERRKYGGILKSTASTRSRLTARIFPSSISRIAQHWCAEVQVHHYSDFAQGIWHRQRNLYQYRCQLPH
jgi:hypothetical protein